MPLWTYNKPPTWMKREEVFASDGGGPTPGHVPGWYHSKTGKIPTRGGELLVCINIQGYNGNCRIDLEGDNVVDDLLLETGDEFLLEVCPLP